MAAARPTLAITSSGSTHSSAGVTIHIWRLWTELAFSRRDHSVFVRKCLLDSGAPVSVIPLRIHRLHDFAWQPLAGPWPPGLTTWMGVPCTVGRMNAWIPVPGSTSVHGPLPFVAKFAQAIPPNLPRNPPILLGLNFLADHQTDTNLQCRTSLPGGVITLP
jgi:hypothetical protein